MDLKFPKSSGIYLINIGKATELKEIFNLNSLIHSGIGDENDYYVFKFGRSDNLNRRLTEHKKFYGKLYSDVNIKLSEDIKASYFLKLEEESLFLAERDIAHLLRNVEFESSSLYFLSSDKNGKMYNEIFISSINLLSEIIHIYKYIEFKHQKRVPEVSSFDIEIKDEKFLKYDSIIKRRFTSLKSKKETPTVLFCKMKYEDSVCGENNPENFKSGELSICKKCSELNSVKNLKILTDVRRLIREEVEHKYDYDLTYLINHNQLLKTRIRNLEKEMEELKANVSGKISL